MSSSPFEPKKRAAGENVQKVVFLKSRERKCVFSLDFRSFGPSVFDGARTKTVLRGEG